MAMVMAAFCLVMDVEGDFSVDTVDTVAPMVMIGHKLC